jgi:hypothetical protein
MPDKKPDPVDATTTVSPQPSIDPVYQAGKTSWKNEVNLAMIDGEPLPIDSSTVNERTGEVTVEDTNKPVRYSVQAEEVLKRGGVEPH